MKQIKVFQADTPSEILNTVDKVNQFLAKNNDSSVLAITEAGASTGYSYTVTVEYDTPMLRKYMLCLGKSEGSELTDYAVRYSEAWGKSWGVIGVDEQHIDMSDYAYTQRDIDRAPEWVQKAKRIEIKEGDRA